MWTIHDNGLKPIGEPGVTGESFDWYGAMNYCETLVLAGYDDWGLPDIDSLESLLDRDARSYCGTFGSESSIFRVYCRIRAPITLTDLCVWTSAASNSLRGPVS